MKPSLKMPGLAILICLPFIVLAADPSADSSKSTGQLLDQLKTSSESSSDPELKSLGSELGTKASALNQSLDGNPKAQGQLQGALSSLLGGSGGQSLGGLQKLTEAKFTSEQTSMAKDVYHVGSAYVVQKNFGSLEGSQSDVAQVVTSLRKGSLIQSLPALKRIGQNAKLTQPQKDLVSSLTDQYAPGLKKAGDSLKNLPGFKKSDPAPEGK
jgi:hypothetical protein